MIEQISEKLKLLVSTKPLVLNLTNYVTQDFMANSLLAIGAAPIMTETDRDLEELINISSSININIGTLNDAFIVRSREALTWARRLGKPVVLDPVAAGASLIRTNVACDFMQQVDIVRGNASEIIALQSSAKGKTLGVEATQSVCNAKAAAIELCKEYGLTIVVSGPVDFITDGERTEEVPFGSPLMSRVTGMGCTLTAIIAAFRAICSDSFEASYLATSYFGLCGELAAKKTASPGSFRTQFIDALYEASLETMMQLCKVKQI